MARLQQFVLFSAVYGTTLLGTSCLNSAPPASLSDSEPSVSNGLFTFSSVSDGSIRVKPVDTTSSITKVDAVGASMSVKNSTVTPSKTAVEIGTVEYTNFKYQLNGTRNCEWSTGMLIPRCTTAATAQTSQDSSTAEEPSAASAAAKADPVDTSPPNVTQAPTPLAGMSCGPNFNFQTKVWQKPFKVALTGSAAELDKIKEVRYTVDNAYGKTFIATNRADNFDAGATFLTPVTSWDVNEAIVVTKAGGQFTLKWARLSWTDSDPAKKAGSSCE